MSSRNVDSRDQYRVGTLEKGLEVLELLEKGSGPLGIQEIARVTGIQRAAVYRLLCTLERRGYVARQENKKYRSTSRRRRILIGYAAPLTGTPFRADVAESLRRAANSGGVDVLMVDNREDDLETSQKNAQLLCDTRVDLAIMFQPMEWIGHAVADKFFHAGIPFITVEIPIQGGVYFGANNYRAGRMAGTALAQFARQNWKGRFDRLVLVESSSATTNVQARLAGVLTSLRETFGQVEDSHVIRLDGHLHRESSQQVVSEMLAKVPRGTRLLISCFNDPTAVGTLNAVRAAGREAEVAIVGQNATQEGRDELRNPASRLIASIAYFPERYGDKLIPLALSVLNREHIPPAVYTDHVVLDGRNIDRFYEGRGSRKAATPAAP